MFANRIKKNLGRLSGWVRKEGIHCSRVYEQDMPEYKVAIDLFEDKWAHVQEFAPPPPDRCVTVPVAPWIGPESHSISH